jgi:hypothetical protein
MKNRSVLFVGALAVVCPIVWAGQAAAYIDFLPPTLGNLCGQATHIYVLRVEKVSTENGVILFKRLEQLKGDGPLSVPDGTVAKQVIRSNVPGAKVILDWAAEGKTAVVFAKDGGTKSPAHVYIDGYWYLVSWNNEGKYWAAVNGEPTMLIRYCGEADKLGDAVAKILRGEEVVVPGMAKDDRKALEERRGKVQDLRASLQILGNFKENVDGDRKPDGSKPEPADKPGPNNPAVKKPGDKTPDGNKPDDTKPVEKKPAEKKPDDGKPVEKKPEDAKPGDKKPEDAKPVEKKPDDTKPVEKKPAEKVPGLVGTVKAISADGKTITLLVAPPEKNKEPAPIEIQLGKGTTITNGKEPGKLAVGQTVIVFLEKGDAKIAASIQIGKPGDQPVKKPAPVEKPAKPAPNTTETKPEEPKKPKEPAKPPRDPAPTSALIDAEIDRQLAKLKVPASPQADDAEFLRRAYLDLTGRIPTYQQTLAFLDSKEPDKRRKLIDELLDRPAYGEHLAAVWRPRLLPREFNVNGKGGTQRDAFIPWLAEQFNVNRGWNAIVADLLTAEGNPTTNPATAFLLAQSEMNQPRPNKITGAVAALFWGVNLRCAECHDHPFTHWKQRDFWGTAAFFAKVRSGGGGGKDGGGSALVEALLAATGGGGKKGDTAAAPAVRGSAIVIPTGSGKASGQVIPARFLGGAEATLDEKEPFRPVFAQWATAADNPYFARAAVNRIWAHFFGRGFVNPLDNFDESNSPSHPELLDRLASEFAASGFDLKHLARCIATSKTYQRTSRSVSGNEADAAAFSHMAVKVLTPEVLFDALASLGQGGGDTGKSSGNAGKASGNGQSREQFLRAFRSDEDVPATEYLQGIPQLLRLMNASSLNRGAAVVDRLVSSGASREEAITTLYLTVLSRRPKAEEIELMSGYIAKCKDNREGYRGVLWMLLNSNEFAMNH